MKKESGCPIETETRGLKSANSGENNQRDQLVLRMKDGLFAASILRFGKYPREMSLCK
jgi:hypothetical protein